MSNNGNYLASGSESGIVNIYSYDKSKKMIENKVLKEFQNLTTSITDV